MNIHDRRNKLASFVKFATVGSLFSCGICYATLPSVMDLGDANASFYGAEASQSGYAVGAAGDVNGDGFDDFLVSAPGDNEETGKVYLFLGRSSGLQPGMSLGSANASFVGESMGQQFGHAAKGAGDLNADGLDDIIISSHMNSQNGTSAGKIYIFFGRTSGWSLNMAASSANATLLGESAMAFAGISMAPIGDANRDGYEDVAIGAYGMNSYAGKVYVVMGATSSNFSADMNLSQFGSYVGEAANDYAGYSIAGGQDYNRDGYVDMLIGAYGHSGVATKAGKVYVVLGHSGTWSQNAPLAQVGIQFRGSTAYDYAGYAVAFAGDTNKDAFSDILIGAPGRDETGDAAGAVGLSYGRSGTSGTYEFSQMNARFNGEAAGDNAGANIAPAADIDGDGYADFLISAHLNDRTAADAGATYLLRGRYSKFSGAYGLSSASTIFTGELTYDNAGFNVTGAGDVDDDGFADLLISAWGSDFNGAASGLSYLVLVGQWVDSDGDGYSEAMGDCDDANGTRYPGSGCSSLRPRLTTR